jgi:hypothetical protein
VRLHLCAIVTLATSTSVLHRTRFLTQKPVQVILRKFAEFHFPHSSCPPCCTARHSPFGVAAVRRRAWRGRLSRARLGAVPSDFRCRWGVGCGDGNRACKRRLVGFGRPRHNVRRACAFGGCCGRRGAGGVGVKRAFGLVSRKPRVAFARVGSVRFFGGGASELASFLAPVVVSVLSVRRSVWCRSVYSKR